MHEAALAESILKIILDTALRNEAKEVVRVEMEVGEICLVNIEQLSYLIGTFARDTIAKDMEFLVKKETVGYICKTVTKYKF